VENPSILRGRVAFCNRARGSRLSLACGPQGRPRHGSFQLCGDRIGRLAETLTIASTDRAFTGLGRAAVRPRVLRFG